MWINGNYWTKSGLYVGVTCLDIYMTDYLILACWDVCFIRACWDSKPPVETVYFAKSNVCVGNVRPLFNWSWEINPHHPVCESGTAVKSPKKTSYLVKQRKLVMVSAIECHSAVDHHFWCRSPLTSCGKALSSQHTHTTLQQVAGRCLVSFLRGWNTVCARRGSSNVESQAIKL
jgi:hypothetical protein